jgi:uncharacterized protein
MQTRGERTRFPVVYAANANFTFDALKGLSYSIQRWERDAPRFILIGIGYPSDSPFAGSVLRLRDLTFPGEPKFSTVQPPYEGVLIPEKGAKDYYGAEDFQRFIADELIPFIDRHYATIPGDRTYFGHAAAGTFGLFTVFTRPELFKNYLISSPALFYHGTSSAGIRYDNYEFGLEKAREFVASGRALSGITIYLSVGSEEEFEPGALAHWQLTSRFYHLARLLQQASMPGLELVTEVFAGETHMTVWPMAYIHGVKAVLGTEACRAGLVTSAANTACKTSLPRSVTRASD